MRGENRVHGGPVKNAWRPFKMIIKCECCDKLLTNDYMTLMIIKDEYIIPINYCDVMCISIKWGVVEVVD